MALTAIRYRSPVVDCGPAYRWLCYYFPDEDIVFYQEVGEAGGEDEWVLRQVELQGPARVPIAAASLAEWPNADTPGGLKAVRDYEARYGALAAKRLTDADPDSSEESISAEAFEVQWRLARSYLERH